MSRYPAVLLVTVLVISACASSSGAGPGAGSRNLITLEELNRLPNENAYEAIQRLRPRWLASRGRTSMRDPTAGQPLVYVDGIRHGDLSSLRVIRTHDIEEIRFESAAEATTTRGTGHTGGAILIITRKR